jgi:hypothetical protein
LKWPPIRWLAISLLGLLIFTGLIIGGGAILRYTGTTIGQVASASQRQTICLKNHSIQLLVGSYDRGQYWAPLTENIQSGRYTDVLGDISLSVRPTMADSIIFTTIKTASATFEIQAANYSRNITYSYNFKDSILVINPYFRFPLKDGMHYQKAKFIIGIPVNTELQIDNDLCSYINSADFIGETCKGGIYLMTNSGLQLLVKVGLPLSNK